MSDTQSLLQDFDQPQTNPLQTTTATSANNSTSTASSKNFVSHLNFKDPRIIILATLVSILVILLLVSLVLVLVRKTNLRTQVRVPTSNPTSTPAPTLSNPQIPSQFLPRFQEIESKIKSTTEFLPPEIDTTIGL